MRVQVKVSQGYLQGKECFTPYGKNYYSFEGIPYARPPVGDLRFRDPQEPRSWSGVREAVKPGNKCSQLNPYSDTSIEGSEDCLYLNVYTPNITRRGYKMPVIFFIHGGRFIFGYGDYYRPDYLIKHNIVLVTINYRLHILGFLCLNIPEVPGNAAMKDAIMALKWVNTNIAAFNGDPNNITVMGESAGAGIAGAFMTSKMADGLFHKVICQSGVPTADLCMIEEDPINRAKMVAANLGAQLNDERSLYEFLLNVPISELIMAFSVAELSRPPSVLNALFLPVVEQEFEGVERFYDQYPIIDIAMNRYKNVPFLAGMNSHEAALFLRKDGQGNIYFEQDFYYFIPRYLNIKTGDKRTYAFEKKLRKYYFNNQEVNMKTKAEYIDMISDFYFNFDILQLVETLASNSSNVFCYKFQYNGGLNTRVMKNLNIRGTCHGDMMQYQFYRTRKHDLCSMKDIKIIEMLAEAWCTFARNGTPSWSKHNLQWLPYTPEEKKVLVIDDETILVENPFLHRLKFWQSLVNEFSQVDFVKETSKL